MTLRAWTMLVAFRRDGLLPPRRNRSSLTTARHPGRLPRERFLRYAAPRPLPRWISKVPPACFPALLNGQQAQLEGPRTFRIEPGREALPAIYTVLSEGSHSCICPPFSTSCDKDEPRCRRFLLLHTSRAMEGRLPPPGPVDFGPLLPPAQSIRQPMKSGRTPARCRLEPQLSDSPANCNSGSRCLCSPTTQEKPGAWVLTISRCRSARNFVAPAPSNRFYGIVSTVGYG